MHDIDKNELLDRLNRTITFIDKNVARSFVHMQKVKKDLEDTVKWIEGAPISQEAWHALANKEVK